MHRVRERRVGEGPRKEGVAGQGGGALISHSERNKEELLHRVLVVERTNNTWSPAQPYRLHHGSFPADFLQLI